MCFSTPIKVVFCSLGDLSHPVGATWTVGVQQPGSDCVPGPGSVQAVPALPQLPKSEGGPTLRCHCRYEWQC